MASAQPVYVINTASKKEQTSEPLRMRVLKNNQAVIHSRGPGCCGCHARRGVLRFLLLLAVSAVVLVMGAYMYMPIFWDVPAPLHKLFLRPGTLGEKQYPAQTGVGLDRHMTQRPSAMARPIMPSQNKAQRFPEINPEKILDDQENNDDQFDLEDEKEVKGGGMIQDGAVQRTDDTIDEDSSRPYSDQIKMKEMTDFQGGDGSGTDYAKKGKKVEEMEGMFGKDEDESEDTDDDIVTDDGNILPPAGREPVAMDTMTSRTSYLRDSKIEPLSEDVQQDYHGNSDNQVKFQSNLDDQNAFQRGPSGNTLNKIPELEEQEHTNAAGFHTSQFEEIDDNQKRIPDLDVDIHIGTDPSVPRTQAEMHSDIEHTTSASVRTSLRGSPSDIGQPKGFVYRPRVGSESVKNVHDLNVERQVGDQTHRQMYPPRVSPLGGAEGNGQISRDRGPKGETGDVWVEGQRLQDSDQESQTSVPGTDNNSNVQTMQSTSPEPDISQGTRLYQHNVQSTDGLHQQMVMDKTPFQQYKALPNVDQMNSHNRPDSNINYVKNMPMRLNNMLNQGPLEKTSAQYPGVSGISSRYGRRGGEFYSRDSQPRLLRAHGLPPHLPDSQQRIQPPERTSEVPSSRPTPRLSQNDLRKSRTGGVSMGTLTQQLHGLRAIHKQIDAASARLRAYMDLQHSQIQQLGSATEEPTHSDGYIPEANVTSQVNGASSELQGNVSDPYHIHVSESDKNSDIAIPVIHSRPYIYPNATQNETTSAQTPPGVGSMPQMNASLDHLAGLVSSTNYSGLSSGRSQGNRSELVIEGEDVRAVPPGVRVLTRYRTRVLHVNMTDEQAEYNFFKRCETVYLACDEYAVYGEGEKGGWPVCLAGPYRPTKPCHIYTISTPAKKNSFENSITKDLGCLGRTLNISTETTSNTAESVTDVHWKYLADLQSPIDYLKLDLSSNEWSALESPLAGKSLSKVKQLGITIHTNTQGPSCNTTSPWPSVKDLLRYDRVMTFLEDLGFMRWWSRMNRWGLRQSRHYNDTYVSACYTMVYLNKHFFNDQSQRNSSYNETNRIDNTTSVTSEAERKFLSSVGSINTSCDLHYLHKHRDDGGWDVCLSPIHRDNCTVYVLDASRRTQKSIVDVMNSNFGCKGSIFDLSNIRQGQSPLTTSHIKLQGQREVSNDVKSLSFRHLNNMTNPGKGWVDVVMVDMEHEEWGVLEAMMDQGELHIIRQLILYVHTKAVLQRTSSEDDFKRYYKVLSRLEMEGFKKWRLAPDEYTGCDVTFTGSDDKRPIAWQMNYINSRSL